MNDTIDLTISQPVIGFSYYAWKQSNIMHEKDSLLYIVCAGNLCTHCPLLSCLLAKKLWLAVNKLGPNYWANEINFYF
jgi:hypothetical protein